MRDGGGAKETEDCGDDVETEDRRGKWAESFSIPSYSARLPMAIHGGAGSHTWSNSLWSSGSRAMAGIVLSSGSGSLITAGLSSSSVMGCG